METGIAERSLTGTRVLIALVLLMGGIVGATRGVSAQTSVPGVDGNTYDSPNYDYSLTWDETGWDVRDGYDADGAESVMLGRLDAYLFVILKTFPADASNGYCGGYPDQLESGRDVAITPDYGRPTPPDGSTTATYLVGPQPGDDADVIHYVVCSSLTAAGDELQIVVIAEAPDFDRLIPVVDDLLSGLTLPSDDSSAVEPNPVSYTDDEYGYSLSYDANAWRVLPLGGDGVALVDSRPDSGATFLSIAGTSEYGGSVADCVADAPMVANGSPDAEVRSFEGDASIIDGLGVDGGEVTVFVNTFGGSGDTGEDWTLVACVPLDDASVLIVQVSASESVIPMGAIQAKAVIDTIQIP